MAQSQQELNNNRVKQLGKCADEKGSGPLLAFCDGERPPGVQLKGVYTPSLESKNDTSIFPSE